MKERLFAGCLKIMFLLWQNFSELAWYHHQSIFYPISQTIFICLCPYFHRFCYILLCSVVCHVAIVLDHLSLWKHCLLDVLISV